MTSIYNQTIKMFGSHAEPGFESAEQQTSVWGREWGCDNDVGQIRVCLMHRPGDEMEIIDRTKRIEEIGSYGDMDKGWYFQSDVVPDWGEFRAQHDGLVKTLQAEGVEVVFLDSVEPDGIKSVYTRDSSFAIKGGAIVTRLARTIRRGEESHVTRTLANLGMPILRTVHGTGLAEGGSFAWLNDKTAAIGRSICNNDEACDQIEQVLNAQGVELLRVDMSGYSIHIDGHLTMIDKDVAILDPDGLPYVFLQKLKELGIRTVEVSDQDNHWIINCLAVSPGRVIMPRGISNKTADTLASMDIEIIEIDYDKVQLNGGGIHCSTCPLIRDSVY
ncbi:MAG: amidinotransferase [Rhodospirillaceae bacterium]|nr:amidinotransferase [Rhodospirillaceae bacterium]|tara:strand:+ start:1109 stop:2101 length:993 start_codon:yes stop_codon:yes gene_type:complete